MSTLSGTLDPNSSSSDQNVNLDKVGGAAISEGQKTMANSLPVVIASDQSALPNNLTQVSGSAITLGSKTSANSFPVVIASDDMVNTVSAQAVRVTGTITNSASVVTTAVSQYSVATVTVSGTYAGITINFEASDDSGVTYYSVLGSLSSSSASAATAFTPTSNSSNMYNVTLPGVTNFRVRASAYTSGTMNVGITATADPMVFNVAAGIVGTPTIQGPAVSGATKSGGPVQVGAVFNTTQPTVTTGQIVEAQATARGAFIVATGVDAFSTTPSQATAANLNAQVVGSIASGSSDSGNPVKIGGIAINAEQTAVTNAQRVNAVYDLQGRALNFPFSNKENIVSGTGTTTGTSDTSIIAAQGAGVKFYMTGFSVYNTGATTATITFKNGSGGSTLWLTIAPAAGGSNFAFPSPIATSANTALFFAAGSSSTTIGIAVTGFKGA